MAKDFKTGSYTNDKVSARREPEGKKMMELIDEVRVIDPVLEKEINKLIEENYGSTTPRFYDRLSEVIKEKSLSINPEEIKTIVDKIVADKKNDGFVYGEAGIGKSYVAPTNGSVVVENLGNIIDELTKDSTVSNKKQNLTKNKV